MKNTPPAANPTPAQPVQPGERIVIVDILRGFAILGILVVNMIDFAGQPGSLQNIADPIDRFEFLLAEFFVRAKFYTLFSFLFGWGMAVQMRRAAARGADFKRIYSRRLLILLLFGVVHGVFIWSGDILTYYALMGFLLLLFRKRSDKFILTASGLMLLFPVLILLPGHWLDSFRNGYADLTSFLRWGNGSPTTFLTGTYSQITAVRAQQFSAVISWIIYPFGNVFAMFLLGLFVGRRKLFERVESNLTRVKLLFGLLVIPAAGLNWLFISTSIWNWRQTWPAWINPDYYTAVRVAARTFGAPSLMLVYVTGFILLLRRERWRQQLTPLAPVGRMALSNYIFQSLLATLIFYNYGLGLYGNIGPSFGLVLTSLIFLWQIRLSAWWLEKYQYGPLEWVWRVLTYGRIQPMRRGITYVDLHPINRRDLLPKSTSARLLTAVWTFLFLWTIGLAAWVARPGGADASVLSSLSGTNAEATPVPTAAVADQGNDAPVPVATPVVQPVTSDPGPLVKTGDLTALANAFDVESAIRTINELADPKYGGRLAGSPGGYAAGETIARQFAAYGLQPAGDDGTFFQNFPVQPLTLVDAPNLLVTSNSGEIIGEYKVNHDFAVIASGYMGAGQVEGEVIWASNCAHQDFDLIDAVGKIVLCRLAGNVSTMARNVVEHGGAGLLLLSNENGREMDFAFPFSRSWLPDGLTLPTFRINTAVAAALVQDSGKTAPDLTISFTSFPLATHARLEVGTAAEAACNNQTCLGRNVLAVLPGRNPDLADEVVILGGHYDHMGRSPEGTIWRGANDNASGIAALLEIAHIWHEQGFVPQRTVLFAAWDGEELGLLGSSFYVEHPQYPLEKTVGSLNLDMVGAGEDILYIDGSGGFEQSLGAIAASYGITTTHSNTGRSDHTPFSNAGVPSHLLIWFGGGDGVPSYHRPEDVPSAIEPEKLSRVGRVAGSMVLMLAEGEPRIEQLLERRAAAVVAGDESAFLDTAVTDRLEQESAWFTEIQSLHPLTVTMTASNLHLAAGEAAGQVKLVLITPTEDGEKNRASTFSFPGRFVPEGGSWRWAGGAFQMVEVNGWSIALPLDSPVSAEAVGKAAIRVTEEVHQKLSLPAEAGSIWLYPNSEALRADTAVSLPAGTAVNIEPGRVKLLDSVHITSSQTLTTSLTQMMLANAGVAESAAPWLWRGLPLALAAELDQEAVQKQLLPDLRQGLADETKSAPDAAAWAAVEYLRKQIGWNGIGQLIINAGLSGMDPALQTAVNMDSASFTAAWQSDWRSRLLEVDQALTNVLTERTTTVRSGSQSGFLATVSREVPYLLAEQANWFGRIPAGGLAEAVFTGQARVLYPDGRVMADITFTGGDGSSESAAILFTPRASGLTWAGVPLETLPGDQITLLYPSGYRATAQNLQQELIQLVPLLAQDLGTNLDWPMTLKLYKSETDFKFSIFPNSLENYWGLGWSQSDAAIKLRLLPGADFSEMLQSAAVQMGRYMLFRQGVDENWLMAGASLLAAEKETGPLSSLLIDRNVRHLLRAVQTGSLPSLSEYSSPDELNDEDGRLFNAAILDAVRTLEFTYGRSALEDLIHQIGIGASLTAAMGQRLGLTQDEFETAWSESLAVAHIQPDWVEIAGRFDVDRAVTDISFITRPEYAGRQAGSPGSAAVADYVAGEFASAGLQPIGVPLTGTNNLVAYEQPFPIEYFTLATTPMMALVDEDGLASEFFTFRHEFVAPLDQVLASGSADGELVLVSDPDYMGMDLSGKIVIRIDPQSTAQEALTAAAHGASGLILVSRIEREKEFLAKPAMPITSSQTISIPVVLLTQPGFMHFLDSTGQTRASVANAPPALPLGVRAHLSILLNPPIAAEAVNVLGLLPGSDPVLKEEVIIVGAHYDYVGDDPDTLICGGYPIEDLSQFSDSDCERLPGLTYSGANDNASGVAVMLEIARLWHESGYHPQRSVLFAAWGAQEPGQIGSNYYIGHPAFPLTQTVGMLQLDAVGGGSGYYLSGKGEWEKDGLFLLGLTAAEDLVDGRLKTSIEAGDSDQKPFIEAGIPALLVNWTDASESNWPDTIADEVEPFRLGVAGKMVALTLMAAAQ